MGERVAMARSSGSARVPVSIRVTRGSSESRIVPGRMSMRAKTPRPLPGESVTDTRVLRVSG